MRILLINGPNLNRLGHRDPAVYGTPTLAEIEDAFTARVKERGAECVCFQANGEGQIIDFLQGEIPNGVDGIVINPGALTHYGLSLRDALQDVGAPIVEVHLSNIHAREEFRRRSVIAPIARGQMTGFGWRAYLWALDFLADELGGESK